MLLLAAGAFVATRYLHDLTLIAIIGPISYVIGMATLLVLARAWHQREFNKYVVSAVLLLASGLVYSYVRHIWEYHSWTFTYTPEWALGNTGISYYAEILIREYPILFQTLLLTIAGALAWKPKPTLYVTACSGCRSCCRARCFPGSTTATYFT